MDRRRLLLTLPLIAAGPAAHAQQPPWQTLPPTPAPPAGAQAAVAAVNGIRLAYLRLGSEPPVVLLHGGLANYDYWGHQIAALAPTYGVIAVDSRGHGRSTRDSRPFGYDLMADDVVALLDHLGIARADIVGWSDGGIIALDLAMRHATRVGRVFAFAANSRTDGVIGGVEKNPTFARFIERARAEYRRLSPTPDGYDSFLAQIGRMWATQPNWSDAQLRSIRAPTWIVDGDHDEAIKRPHTEYLAATVPGAGLLILPNVSHFAFLQDPPTFNAALLRFLAGP